ncbi:unnamed protein product [Vitrella brassicaformis CCMP3155]|uniref:GST C-terminal domain-containing protein n=1 Tax=Vitrella brassicaformis (strain CCMP3155) TaxID=1169540 RepID=A0A0G4FU09_VITBC|nr:unnamed protein product [Vitrella brassicaformis CCMP3155]|eukprot:CEM18448.1 unnamed protein product [Vitrella brassicaformis CCMP3155]
MTAEQLLSACCAVSVCSIICVSNKASLVVVVLDSHQDRLPQCGGLVPVLVIDGQPVAESEATLDAIAELAPSLATPTPSKRQQWRDMLEQRLIPVGKAAVLNPSSKNMAALRVVIAEWEAKLRERPGKGHFLCGESLSIADVSAVPFWSRLQEEMDCVGAEEFPLTHEWLAACRAREAVRRTQMSSWWWWW